MSLDLKVSQCRAASTRQTGAGTEATGTHVEVGVDAAIAAVVGVEAAGEATTGPTSTRRMTVTRARAKER